MQPLHDPTATNQAAPNWNDSGLCQPGNWELRRTSLASNLRLLTTVAAELAPSAVKFPTFDETWPGGLARVGCRSRKRACHSSVLPTLSVTRASL